MHPDIPWLPPGAIQGDALADLNTQSNKLSVWLVENDRSNLSRIVAAMGANVQSFANVDYALFECTLMSDLAITVREVRGETPDDQVNEWHRDLVDLSGERLLQLATSVASKSEIQRVTEARVRELILQGITAHEIVFDRVHEKLRAKLLKLLR